MRFKFTKELNTQCWHTLFHKETRLNRLEPRLDSQRDLTLDFLWVRYVFEPDDKCIPASSIDYLERPMYNRPFPFRKL